MWNTLTANKRNDPAIEAYRHHGFRIRGPIVTDIGGGFVMDDHRMELDISAQFYDFYEV